MSFCTTKTETPPSWGFDPAAAGKGTIVIQCGDNLIHIFDETDNRGRHLGTLNGEKIFVLGPGEHPLTKELFRLIVERERDFAIIGFK